MCDLRNVGCLIVCEPIVASLGCGMLRMWNIPDVGCLGCGILVMYDVWNVGCLGCGMSGMRDAGWLP